MKSHMDKPFFFEEEWFKTLKSNDVQGSLEDRLTMILEYIESNPSLTGFPQHFEFKNGNQPFTLTAEFSFGNDGKIKCEKCEYHEPWQRNAANPIREAVKEKFKTQLVSIISEQARRNVLGEFGVFHHAKQPSHTSGSILPPTRKPKPPMTG